MAASLNYGKLDFATSFKRLSAFPLEANSFFLSLPLARAAAQTAVEVGSSESANSTYYIGQTVTVVEGADAKSYIIQPDKTLKEVGSGSIGKVTATIDNNVGIPAVDVSTQQDGSIKNFQFNFRNLKGQPGAQGLRGPEGQPGAQGPRGPEGPPGPTGPQGPAGSGVNIKGTISSTSQLPSSGQSGDAYLDGNGIMYVYVGTGGDVGGGKWKNVGTIRGPQGLPGQPGERGPVGPAGPPAGFADVHSAQVLVKQGVGPQVIIRAAQDTPNTAKVFTFDFYNIMGPKGDPGAPGKDGTGVNIKGTVDSSAQLPSTGTKGDAYLDKNGILYVYVGTGGNTGGGKWQSAGNIKGPAGTDGKTWRPTVASDGNLSWALNSSTSVPPTTNIRGPQGQNGNPGPAGPPGAPGAPGTSISFKGSFDSISQAGTGKAGDVCFTNNGDFYKWDTATGKWVKICNLRGPQGLPGQAGAAGEASGIPIITKDQLDAEGSTKESIDKIIAGQRPILQVQDNGSSAGVVFQYMDNLKHVITQEFLTHYTVVTSTIGGIDGTTASLTAHNHHRIIKLVRVKSFGTKLTAGTILRPANDLILNGKDITDYSYFQELGYDTSSWPTPTAEWPRATWTPWRDMEHEMAVIAQREHEQNKHNAVKTVKVIKVNRVLTNEPVLFQSAVSHTALFFHPTGGLSTNGRLVAYSGGKYYSNWADITPEEKAAIAEGRLVVSNADGSVWSQTGDCIVDTTLLSKKYYTKTEVDNIVQNAGSGNKLTEIRKDISLSSADSDGTKRVVLEESCDFYFVRVNSAGTNKIKFVYPSPTVPKSFIQERPRTFLFLSDSQPTSSTFVFHNQIQQSDGKLMPIHFINFNNQTISFGGSLGDLHAIFFTLRIVDGQGFLQRI